MKVVVPIEDERGIIHRIIYEELCLGLVLPESRIAYRKIMANLAAQAIILGCTEIFMLVSQQDAAVPLFDTTAIHARAVAKAALEK